MKKKRIAILGSTGSIGRQALEVIAAHPERFEVEVLTAYSSAELLIAQAVIFNPNVVVIGKESQYDRVKTALDPLDIKVYCGDNALKSVVENQNIDIVLTAIPGFAGLESTLRAIEYKKQIALANEEALVIAGDLIVATAAGNQVNIIPVGFKHSAIFQCLMGEYYHPVEKVILATSGGPFLGKSKDFLETVTPEQALKHPIWKMGRKASVNAASLMNKGMEMIAIHRLFGLRAEQIEVLIHPQSIIQSMVQFGDGSIKAQMSQPDMRIPIQYTLSFPERLNNELERIDFTKLSSLDFQQVNEEVFKNLEIARKVIKKSGNTGCILNAANEVAVDAFLSGSLSFTGMTDLIEQCLTEVRFIDKPTLEDYIETNKITRALAQEKL